MSIKGGSYRWFQLALQRGDLATVRATAIELGRRVNLVDALSIVLLMADQRDRAFDRAATKWLARLVLERPGVGLQDLELALSALAQLRDDPAAGRRDLAEVCRRHNLDEVLAVLASEQDH